MAKNLELMPFLIVTCIVDVAAYTDNCVDVVVTVDDVVVVVVAIGVDVVVDGTKKRQQD